MLFVPRILGFHLVMESEFCFRIMNGFQVMFLRWNSLVFIKNIQELTKFTLFVHKKFHKNSRWIAFKHIQLMWLERKRSHMQIIIGFSRSMMTLNQRRKALAQKMNKYEERTTLSKTLIWKNWTHHFVIQEHIIVDNGYTKHDNVGLTVIKTKFQHNLFKKTPVYSIVGFVNVQLKSNINLALGFLFQIMKNFKFHQHVINNRTLRDKR